MATKEQLEKVMREFVDKANEVCPEFAQGWAGTIQVNIPDLGTGWFLKFAMDGTVESCVEKVDEENAEGVLECDSDLFSDIWDKKIGGMEALAMGKLQVRKSLDALMKMMPVMIL